MKAAIQTFLKSFFSRQNSIVRAVTALVLSIFLIAWNQFMGKGTVLLLGAGCILYAGLRILQTSRRCWKDRQVLTDGSNHPAFLQLLKAIPFLDYLTLLSGILLMVFSSFLSDVLMMLFAILIIVQACLQLQAWYLLRARLRQKSAVLLWISFSLPFILLVLAAIILANPFPHASGLTLFTGITLLFLGLTETARILFLSPLEEN